MIQNNDFLANDSLTIDRKYLIYVMQKVENIYKHTRNVINNKGRHATKFAIKKIDELDSAVKTAQETCYFTPITQFTTDNVLNFFIILQYISCECFSILSPSLKKKKVNV